MQEANIWTRFTVSPKCKLQCRTCCEYVGPFFRPRPFLQLPTIPPCAFAMSHGAQHAMCVSPRNYTLGHERGFVSGPGRSPPRRSFGSGLPKLFTTNEFYKGSASRHNVLLCQPSASVCNPRVLIFCFVQKHHQTGDERGAANATTQLHAFRCTPWSPVEPPRSTLMYPFPIKGIFYHLHTKKFRTK